MGRNRLMTAGILLVLIGVQLYCVRTYFITPAAAKFVKQRIIEVDEATAAESTTAPFFSTGFANQRFGSGLQSIVGSPAISPPSWLKWAALFAGSVLVLQGSALPK
jgi:hypothetical protein